MEFKSRGMKSYHLRHCPAKSNVVTELVVPSQPKPSTSVHNDSVHNDNVHNDSLHDGADLSSHALAQMSKDIADLKEKLTYFLEMHSSSVSAPHVTNNVVTSTTNNITNNITINIVGHENLSYLDGQELDFLMWEAVEKSREGFIDFMLETHFGHREPSNHNVRYIRNPEVLELYRAGGWSKEDVENGLQRIVKHSLKRFEAKMIDYIEGRETTVSEDDVNRFIGEVVAPGGQFWDRCTWIDPCDPELNPDFDKNALHPNLQRKREELFDGIKEAFAQATERRV